MKKLYLPILIITLSFGVVPPAAAAEVSPPMPAVNYPVIAAVQTGQTSASGNDFVEIYNPTTAGIDMTGWKLQYKSATAATTASWTTKRTVACEPVVADCRVALAAHSTIIFATYDVLNINEQPVSSGFGSEGGQLRLVNADGQQLDMVGYGTAVAAEGGKPAPAPNAGEVLVRGSKDDMIIDTDNNSADFTAGCYAPTPQGEIMPAPVPIVLPCPSAAPPNPADEDSAAVLATVPGDGPVQAGPYAPLTITELLPDPASPQTDSADEFIELFNPGTEPVDASGYVLESGSDFRYHFTLADVVVPAQGYVAIMSAESHLNLTNSGTAVRVRDPAGAILDTVASYGTAKSGQAWARIGDTWQWTTSPSPAAANVLTVPVLAASTKKPATTKTTKTTAAKTPKAAAPKNSSKVAAAGPLTNEPQESQGFNYWLLAPIGLFVVGYLCYEYRHEFAKAWQRIRGRQHLKPAKTLATQNPVAATRQTD